MLYNKINKWSFILFNVTSKNNINTSEKSSKTKTVALNSLSNNNFLINILQHYYFKTAETNLRFCIFLRLINEIKLITAINEINNSK